MRGGVRVDGESAFVWTEPGERSPPPVIYRWASVCRKMWLWVSGGRGSGFGGGSGAGEGTTEREGAGGRSSCRAAGCPAFACPGIPPQP